MRLHHNLEKGTTEHGLLCQVYCESPWMDLCDINALWRQFAKRSKAGKPDWRPVTGEQISNLNKRMWRFIPLLDPLVDVLITRDLDASIIEREIVAVRQWLESNFTFHVMRDHHGHTARILAGFLFHDHVSYYLDNKNINLTFRNVWSENLSETWSHRGVDQSYGGIWPEPKVRDWPTAAGQNFLARC